MTRSWTRACATFGSSRAPSPTNLSSHGPAADGALIPVMNAVRRSGQVIRHFWGSELLYAPTDPGQTPRHGDTLEPLWNLFDLTPEGRGTDWYPDFSYS